MADRDGVYFNTTGTNHMQGHIISTPASLRGPDRSIHRGLRFTRALSLDNIERSASVRCRSLPDRQVRLNPGSSLTAITIFHFTAHFRSYRPSQATVLSCLLRAPSSRDIHSPYVPGQTWPPPASVKSLSRSGRSCCHASP